MTPLLLLPGMMCDARLFSPQIDALSGRYPIMTCPIGGHDNMRELAAEILSYAPPAFALAGLSMGGIVAMEIVRQAADRVTKLALLDTNPLAELEAAQARRLPQIEAARSGYLDRIMRDEMKPNYLADTPNRSAIMDLCMDMALSLGSDVFERQSRALMNRPDQRDTLTAYTGQALVLCGRHDALCPVERHELMADCLPNARLEIIEDAGHLPTLEAPQLTNSALESWLTG